MNIREFALNLQKVYEDMSETFGAYQKSTGLNCLASCGRCCTNPEIEASVLEMIPFALKAHDDGTLDQWLDRLETSQQSHCLFLIPNGETGQGYCSSYNERPSVCRMFGVAGTYDKHRNIKLSICKHIKEAHSTDVQIDESIPLIPLWSAKLAALDPNLITKKIPINLAMKEALQKVALYAQYQSL